MYLNGKGCEEFCMQNIGLHKPQTAEDLKLRSCLKIFNLKNRYKLKSGDYPEAVAGFKRNVSIGYPVSFIYLSLETIRLEYAAGNDVEEFGRKRELLVIKYAQDFRNT